MWPAPISVSGGGRTGDLSWHGRHCPLLLLLSVASGPCVSRTGFLGEGEEEGESLHAGCPLVFP